MCKPVLLRAQLVSIDIKRAENPVPGGAKEVLLHELPSLRLTDKVDLLLRPLTEKRSHRCPKCLCDKGEVHNQNAFETIGKDNPEVVGQIFEGKGVHVQVRLQLHHICHKDRLTILLRKSRSCLKGQKYLRYEQSQRLCLASGAHVDGRPVLSVAADDSHIARHLAAHALEELAFPHAALNRLHQHRHCLGHGPLGGPQDATQSGNTRPLCQLWEPAPQLRPQLLVQALLLDTALPSALHFRAK
mmetsp:Transcript_123299/g.293044  ORF Transcript_123299/g.293044 Transcript_123299/m.293044 type:complete len:244 (-) Transcript_123299:375-1106(-)